MRALVLRGEDARSAPGGTSLASTRATTTSRYFGGLVEPLLKRMARFPAPTFAVAHGACLGVGLGLLIATPDIVYVADSAKIGSPFKNLGATLDSGGHALFYERLGAHQRWTPHRDRPAWASGAVEAGRGTLLAGAPGRRGMGGHARGGSRRGIRPHRGLRRLEAAHRRPARPPRGTVGLDVRREPRRRRSATPRTTARACRLPGEAHTCTSPAGLSDPTSTVTRTPARTPPVRERRDPAGDPRLVEQHVPRAFKSSIACSAESPTAVIPTRPCSVIELIMWKTMFDCRRLRKWRPCRATTSNRSPTESARSSAASRWSVATMRFSALAGVTEPSHSASYRPSVRNWSVRTDASCRSAVDLDRVRGPLARHPAPPRSRPRTGRARPLPRAASIAIAGSPISREYAGSAGNDTPGSSGRWLRRAAGRAWRAADRAVGQRAQLHARTEEVRADDAPSTMPPSDSRWSISAYVSKAVGDSRRMERTRSAIVGRRSDPRSPEIPSSSMSALPEPDVVELHDDLAHRGAAGEEFADRVDDLVHAGRSSAPSGCGTPTSPKRRRHPVLVPSAASRGSAPYIGMSRVRAVRGRSCRTE